MRLGYAIAVLVVASGGCGGHRAVFPPSPEIRARMDRVVLEVSASAKPNWISKDKVKVGAGERAASGAGKGASVGAVPLAIGCDLGWNALWPLTCAAGAVVGAGTAVVGGAGGAVYGAATTRTEGEVTSAEGALDKLLQETRPEDLLRNRIASVIRTRTSVTVFEVETRDALVERRGHDDSSSVALLLNICNFSFSRKGDMSPDLWLDLAVSARLYDSLEDPSIYAHEWGMKSNLGDFFKLTNAGAATLRMKLEAEIHKMAEAVVDDLFVTKVAKPEERVPDNGRVVTTGGGGYGGGGYFTFDFPWCR
jgi:hypothetical protein